MDELQKSLIGFGAIIVSIVLVYVGLLWYLKVKRRMNENKMLTMNLVIKYKSFLEYLAYQDKKNRNYYLFLVKVNHLNLVENSFNDHVVRNYLTMVVKELSVYLPFGGKVAQTNQRDTFIIYYPALEEDPIILGKQFKMLAQKTYHENGVHIRKSNSISVVDKNDLRGLSNALVSSVRHLGEPTLYDTSKHPFSEEYLSLADKLKSAKLELKSTYVETIKVNKTKEVYNEVVINELSMLNFLNKLPNIDQAWVNMYFVEYILNRLYLNNIYATISLPVLLSSLESDVFVDYLELIAKSNQFLLENIVISLKLSTVKNEEQVIKNILILSNLGIKISLDLDDINQSIYNQIQKYHIKRIEVDKVLMNHSLIPELLYFSKVNHIEVLYQTNEKNLDEHSLNVTHITKDLVELNLDKQKRGRK